MQIKNLQLKKSMSKKAYRAYCREKRCSLMLGRDYGTRPMRSKRDYARRKKHGGPDFIQTEWEGAER